VVVEHVEHRDLADGDAERAAAEPRAVPVARTSISACSSNLWSTAQEGERGTHALKKKRSSANFISSVKGAAIFLLTSVSLIQGAISGSRVSGSL